MQSVGDGTLELCKKYLFPNTYVPHNEKIMPNFPLVFKTRSYYHLCVFVHVYFGGK